MTYAALKAKFPNASENFLRDNASDAPRQVRGTVKRITVAHTAVDAAPQNAVAKQADTLPLVSAAQDEIGGQGRALVRPRLHVTLYRVALLDPDSKWGSCKFLIDGLRQCGLVPDDRECDIELIVTQQRVPKYEQEGTGVLIEYPKK